MRYHRCRHHRRRRRRRPPCSSMALALAGHAPRLLIDFSLSLSAQQTRAACRVSCPVVCKRDDREKEGSPREREKRVFCLLGISLLFSLDRKWTKTFFFRLSLLFHSLSLFSLVFPPSFLSAFSFQLLYSRASVSPRSREIGIRKREETGKKTERELYYDVDCVDYADRANGRRGRQANGGIEHLPLPRR